MIAVLESSNKSTTSSSNKNPTVKISTRKLKEITNTNSYKDRSRFPFLADMTTANFSHPDTSSVYTVVLQPENPALKTRHLELRADDNRIKIGRHISARTQPQKHNGFFDSKVLSRQHAELYCTEGKAFIRDTKSSNGTFVNGERLSEEGRASPGKRLFNQDIIEFGIDIINDENGTVLFHKVVCKVFLYPEPLSQIEERLSSDWEDNTNESFSIYSSAYGMSDSDSMSTVSHSTTSNTRTSSKNTRFAASENDEPSSSSNQVRDKRLKELLEIESLIKDELRKSKKVETELLSIKQAVTELNRVVTEDKNTNETETKLATVEKRLRSYDEKWHFQHAAIKSAKKELQSWDSRYHQQGKHSEELTKELEAERRKVKELELVIKQKSSLRRQGTGSLILTSLVFGFLFVFLYFKVYSVYLHIF